jgi:hypothetical protein
LRRTRTLAPKVANVAWLLTSAQMQAVDAWFEETLLAGERRFSAQVRIVGGPSQWWDAFWAAPYEADPIPSPHGVLWRVTGRLHLRGEPSAIRPDTGETVVEFGLALVGQAVVTADASVAVEFGLALQPYSLIEVEFGLAFVAVVNGAPASSVDQDVRWSWMRYPYARGHSADLADDEAIRRNWMGF